MNQQENRFEDPIFDKLTDMLQNYSSSILYSMNEKFKEACLAWGVDITNPQEVKERCTVVRREHELGEELFGYHKVKEFHIDGNLVMLFTDWEMIPMDIGNYDPKKRQYTISGAWKCSAIIKPGRKFVAAYHLKSK